MERVDILMDGDRNGQKSDRGMDEKVVDGKMEGRMSR